MVLVDEVVSAVLAAVDSEAGPQLVAGWVSERYRELTNRARFRHLLFFGELVLPPTIRDGLVTVTAGSNVVVGDADARAAWIAAGETIIGRYFRVASQRNWFRVVGKNGLGDLILESDYCSPFSTADDPLVDIAYVLVARFHTLAEGLRHIGVIKHPKLAEPLEEIAHQELDLAMTDRVLVADLPKFWCESGTAADGRKIIEIYPYPRTAQLVSYSYYVHSPALTLDSQLPAEMDLHILKAGALIDVHRWEMAQAARRNQPDAAALWRNEMNSLQTRWEDKIREAVKQGRASDTVSLQLMTGGFPSGGRTVRNAHDLVYLRGNRP